MSLPAWVLRFVSVGTGAFDAVPNEHERKRARALIAHREKRIAKLERECRALEGLLARDKREA